MFDLFYAPTRYFHNIFINLHSRITAYAVPHFIDLNPLQSITSFLTSYSLGIVRPPIRKNTYGHELLQIWFFISSNYKIFQWPLFLWHHLQSMHSFLIILVCKLKVIYNLLSLSNVFLNNIFHTFLIWILLNLKVIFFSRNLSKIPSHISFMTKN